MASPQNQLKTWPPGVVYALAILVFVGTGSAIGLLSGSGGEWYDSLEKSVLTPPGYLFGIVWPILYAMMAISLVMVWRTPSPLRSKALTFFFVQLGVNYAWSFIFFTAQMIALGFIWIIVLVGLVIATILIFAKVNRIAALLLVPYLAWITFASYLSGTILALN